MQTFLPYSDFKKTAKCLDYKRLGKQRVEAKQIYLALTQDKYGWKNHPAVKMWKGCEAALLIYGIEISYEWSIRGYKDKQLLWFVSRLIQDFSDKPIKYPKWLNNKQFHLSHKSNLLRKDEKHYRKYFPKLKSTLPYYWPGEEK